MDQERTPRLTWEKQSILFTAILISIFFPFYIGLTVFLIFFIVLQIREGVQGNFRIQNSNLRCLWAFIFYSFIVSLLGMNGLGIVISLYFPILLIFFHYYQRNVRPAYLESILTITLYASFFLAIYSGLEHFKIISEWDYTFISPAMGKEHPERVEATFFNPNYYATMLEFFVIIGLYKIVRTKKTGKRVLYTLITFGNIVAVVFTGSRVAPLIMVGSVMIFFSVLGHKKTGINVMICFGAIFFAMLLTGNYPRMDSISWALEDRDLIWETAMRGIKDNFLFGQGPLTYRHIFALYGGKETQHAHNLLLNPLLSYGIVGCSLLIYPVFQYGKILLEMRRYEQFRHQFALYCSLIGVVLIQGLADLGILWFQTSFLFLMILMTAPNLLEEVRKEEQAGFVRPSLYSPSNWQSA